MNKREFWALFRASFIIAAIVYFIAIASEFSIRMYYSSADWWVQIFTGLAAIAIVTLLVMVLLMTASDLRRAVLRMFGLETSE